MLTDGSRGEGLVYSGHTEEEKQALAQEITRVVHETIGAPVEYIYVLIRETPGSHHIKAGEALGDYAPESGRS
jgi:4-oxalocrotonate tautomerase family enzyme